MKILALQGGGCRGKAQAVALRELELDGPTPLWQRFDLIGGTSVGAIIGAAVAIGLPMKAVNDFFDQSAPKIFTSHWWTPVTQLWGAKYSSVDLGSALQDIFGTHTLADCKTKFLCTAFDTVSGRNVYFQSYGTSSETDEEVVFAGDRYGNLLLWEIVRASGSAQTYFSAAKIFELGLVGMDLIDGGNTGSAAPDMVCLAEALAMGTPQSTIQMLSLGTGAAKWSGGALENPGIVKAGLATLGILFSGTNAQEVWQAASVLGSNHCRLNPQLSQNYALDDASPGTLGALELAMQVEMSRRVDLLKPFTA